MGLAHEKKSYLQEKANLFEIGSVYIMYQNCDNVNSIINKNCGFYLI